MSIPEKSWKEIMASVDKANKEFGKKSGRPKGSVDPESKRQKKINGGPSLDLGSEKNRMNQPNDAQQKHKIFLLHLETKTAIIDNENYWKNFKKIFIDFVDKNYKTELPILRLDGCIEFRKGYIDYFEGPHYHMHIALHLKYYMDSIDIKTRTKQLFEEEFAQYDIFVGDVTTPDASYPEYCIRYVTKTYALSNDKEGLFFTWRRDDPCTPTDADIEQMKKKDLPAKLWTNETSHKKKDIGIPHFRSALEKEQYLINMVVRFATKHGLRLDADLEWCKDEEKICPFKMVGYIMMEDMNPRYVHLMGKIKDDFAKLEPSNFKYFYK